MTLLRANSELRKHRIWNWTLPAWVITLPDGRRFNTCPHAGPCAQYCYARNGTYLFKNVRAAHMANLMRILDDPNQWQDDMVAELLTKKFRPTGIPRQLPEGTDLSHDRFLQNWSEQGGAAVRIHDSGDFFDDQYLLRWVLIAERIPDVLFYAYTKEVEMLKRYQYPHNFRFIFSTGGTQDHLIGPDDRHADVFPDNDAIAAAGYESQDANDLLCILLKTTKVGIPANNIRHYNKRMAGRRFSELHPNRSTQ